MVYLTQEDWNKFFLPKLFEDNNSFDNELKFFKNIYNIMTFINSKIKNSKQIILSTSMIYFHKYYIQNLINYNNLTPLDKLIISGSCIFLATKSTNYLIRVSVIVNIIMDIIKNKLQNINFEHEKIKEMIFEKEFEILKSMEFCLNVELPYKFILVLKNYFENNTNISSEILIKSCCQYINDLIFFPISLYYTPNTIAISCVKLIKEKYNLVDINLNDVISLSEYKIDLKELNECFLIIQKLFDKL
jgi:hypothetical protein